MNQKKVKAIRRAMRAEGIDPTQSTFEPRGYDNGHRWTTTKEPKNKYDRVLVAQTLEKPLCMEVSCGRKQFQIRKGNS